MDLQEYLSARRELVEKVLDERLPREDNEPEILHKAMRYSVFAGGKRVRPILAIAAAEAVGGTAQMVLPLLVALECVHTYSLIHDDLPAMDDDSLRRGKPTLHTVFGEAIAILAGDALLSFAFQALSSPLAQRLCPAARLLAVIRDLGDASGSRQLVAGQVIDMMSESKPATTETVEHIVRTKTAALIRTSLTCGSRMAGGTEEQTTLLGRFGEDLGAAFQVRDDLLDLEGDAAALGKAIGKDEKRGKATYPNLLGKDRAKALVQELTRSALTTIEPLGARGEPLRLIGKYIAERVN